MEINDALTASLTYAFLAVPGATLLFLLFRKQRQSSLETRNCPHCRSVIGRDEPECSSCRRKIACV